ncbi:MAG TPA: hypothetical protein VM821_04845 [Abditibacteriaceae bacterium]|nr:hypothetical protein [Abditibacteriaceae bacterium]
MSLETQTPVTVELQPQTAAYEAPQIETVLNAEELEREVAYAGIIAISPGQTG